MNKSFDQELQMAFLDEAKELLTEAEQCFLNLERIKDDPSIIDKIFRLAHNFKGSAAAVGFDSLKEFAHKFESLLLKIKNQELEAGTEVVNILLQSNDFLIRSVESLRVDTTAQVNDPKLSADIERLMNAAKVSVETAAPEAPRSPTEQKNNINKAAPVADETIRVALNKIDHLLNNVGELSILQTVMDQHKLQVANPLMKKTISHMSKIIREVQAVSMGLRMLPLKNTFQKMQRVVRDTATQLNKEVEFTSSGDEIELDKTVIELLNDPLTHLIRNSVDHGIETAEKRTSANKNPRGVVSLSAYQMGGHVVIEIRDDGAGLDPERLIRKAVEKNLLKSEERLSKEEAYKLVFLPGFSTKEKVTDVSGRGVGMDVVKTNVSELQGNIEIESELGAGTCFKIVLPLTLAIAEGMVVTVDQDRYVVPITQVQESLRLKGEEVSLINERAEVLNLRGSTLPLYRLSSLLHRPSTRGQASNEGIALVCEGSSGFRFAVLVNDIICQQQVVIKSLGDEIRGFPGISGAAILGDGKASLILDLYEMTSEIRNKRKTKETEAS